MPARFLVAITLALLTSCARTAAAAVNLISADITKEEGGSTTVPGGTVTHTVTGPYAFPNDGENVAVVGPDGLDVLVNLRGTFSHDQGNYITENYTDQRFRVVFSLDEPEAFTFTPSSDPFSRVLNQTLQAEGQSPMALDTFRGSSGVLAPGIYTYSGGINGSSGLGYSGDRHFFTAINLTDMRLTVAPEPAAASLLALGALFALRRTRRH